MKIGPAEVELTGIDRIPTDDWPFLYLRDPTIPALNIRGMAIVAVLSLVILLAFAPVRRARPSGRMFFLGAGFMLLETKGVVHMALLFGATWMVNSIVFFAILTMILLSNLYVLAVRPRRLWPYYALFLAALALNSLIPMDDFLALPGSSKVIASCTVVFLPVFFAGVIFATSFGSSTQPDIDFGSNIGGIILGGLSENFSLILGFNHLIWIAIGYYALSALFRSRTPRSARVMTRESTTPISELGVARRARERDDVADILHAGGVDDRPLEAEAETRRAGRCHSAAGRGTSRIALWAVRPRRAGRRARRAAPRAASRR